MNKDNHEEITSEQRFNKYVEKFYIEEERNPKFITKRRSEVLASFRRSARQISSIDCDSFSVDLMPLDGVRFALKINDSYTLMASKYLVSSDIPIDHFVVSLFKKRNKEFNDITDIEGIKSILESIKNCK